VHTSHARNSIARVCMRAHVNVYIESIHDLNTSGNVLSYVWSLAVSFPYSYLFPVGAETVPLIIIFMEYHNVR